MLLLLTELKVRCRKNTQKYKVLKCFFFFRFHFYNIELTCYLICYVSCSQTNPVCALDFFISLACLIQKDLVSRTPFNSIY